MKMSTFSPTETSCRDCVFATYQNNIQIGCRVGRLEKFKNLECVEFHDYKHLDKEYPDREPHLSYYHIERFCNMCRNKNSNWATKYAGKEVEQATKEVKVKIDWIIYGIELNLDDIKEIFAKITKQTINPHTINVSVEKEISSELNQFLSEHYPEFNWNLQTRMDGETPKEILIDELVDKFSGTHYAVISKKCDISNNITNWLEHTTNENLRRISMAENDDGSLQLFDRGTHIILQKNKAAYFPDNEVEIVLKNLSEKIRWAAKEYSKENMIVKI